MNKYKIYLTEGNSVTVTTDYDIDEFTRICFNEKGHTISIWDRCVVNSNHIIFIEQRENE